MTGIYYIKCLVDSKMYIGKSIDVVARIAKHFSSLSKGKHCNNHLQSSFNIHGRDNFVDGVLCKCSFKKLNEREMHYIRLYNSTHRIFGYNIKPGGGRERVSEETKVHLRSVRIGKPVYGFSRAGEYIKTWVSISHCAEELKVSPCDVRRTINLKQRYCRKYALSHTNEYKTRESMRGIHLESVKKARSLSKAL